MVTGEYFLESQYIAEQFGRPHEVAKASHKKDWSETTLRTPCMMFIDAGLREQFDNVANKEEKNEKILHGMSEFVDNYHEIVERWYG